jgi:hypothetical protein
MLVSINTKFDLDLTSVDEEDVRAALDNISDKVNELNKAVKDSYPANYVEVVETEANNE